jgi:hypothetical protein
VTAFSCKPLNFEYETIYYLLTKDLQLIHKTADDGHGDDAGNGHAD